jgi:hypothetical protein
MVAVLSAVLEEGPDAGVKALALATNNAVAPTVNFIVVVYKFPTSGLRK